MSYVQKGRGAVSHAQRGMGVKVLTPISLEVSENGTTKAPAGFAYDTVIADVPNTYSEADNYKVIHNGELFVQAENVPITANGSVDTKFIGSVIVTVPSETTMTLVGVFSTGTTEHVSTLYSAAGAANSGTRTMLAIDENGGKHYFLGRTGTASSFSVSFSSSVSITNSEGTVTVSGGSTLTVYQCILSIPTT